MARGKWTEGVIAHSVNELEMEFENPCGCSVRRLRWFIVNNKADLVWGALMYRECDQCGATWSAWEDSRWRGERRAKAMRAVYPFGARRK